MKFIKKKLVESFIFSKICITNPLPFADSSHFNTLLGNRNSFFSLLNPFLLKTSIKTGLLVLEAFLIHKHDILFIANIDDKILFNRFYQICKKKNFLLVKHTDVSLGFLSSRRAQHIVVVTLFLSPLKTELIQREAALTGTPVITFGSLLTSKHSSLLHVGGNYGLFAIQNLILTLLTICLEKKNGSA
jgi:hypothetical protein